MNAQSQSISNPGLEGVIAADTRLSHVDGERAAGVAGWTAHCFEQRVLGPLIRPRSRYIVAAPG